VAPSAGGSADERAGCTAGIRHGARRSPPILPAGFATATAPPSALRFAGRSSGATRLALLL